jgi:hypothetical protein
MIVRNPNADGIVTTGLRCAKDCSLEQASALAQWAQAARDMGYEDEGLPDILEQFAAAIWGQREVYLSRETEARIAALMADGRVVAVNHLDHNGEASS